MDTGDVNVRDLLHETSARAIGYLEGLSKRSVAPSREAIGGLEALDVPLPD